jgi:VIT1/CCC1 family predicted Fe2+/Mn2+ transporter
MTTIRPSAMGFHDGIVSITVMMLSLVTSGAATESLVTPGLAAAYAGALSMSLGEYSSVSAAHDRGFTHENPIHAGVSSFASFLLGAAIPVLVVANGGGAPELVSAVGMLIAVSSTVNGVNVPRTLSITGVALVLSVLFGRVL